MTLCEVCERRESVSTCRICGRYVCSYHIGGDGVCSICRETLCERCKRYLSIGYCKICGRYLCEDCLIQITPVEYVCKDCYSTLNSCILLLFLFTYSLLLFPYFL